MPQKDRIVVSRTISDPLPDKRGNWYYKVGRRIEGPYTFPKMRELAREKIILKETEVWKVGEEETKRLAASVMGLIPNRTAKPKNLQSLGKVSKKEGENPYAVTAGSGPGFSAAPESPPPLSSVSRTIQDGPPGGLYLPYLSNSPFWIIPLLIGGGIFLFSSGSALIASEEASLALQILGALTLLGSIFTFLLYLHRGWEMMRVFGKTLSGHQAVLLMSIPVLSGVWSFYAVYGWSKMWNNHAKNHPGLKQASSTSPLLFLLFSISFSVSQCLFLFQAATGQWPKEFLGLYYQFTLAAYTLTLILALAAWAQLCRAINFLARKKS